MMYRAPDIPKLRATLATSPRRHSLSRDWNICKYSQDHQHMMFRKKHQEKRTGTDKTEPFWINSRYLVWPAPTLKASTKRNNKLNLWVISEWLYSPWIAHFPGVLLPYMKILTRSYCHVNMLTWQYDASGFGNYKSPNNQVNLALARIRDITRSAPQTLN